MFIELWKSVEMIGYYTIIIAPIIAFLNFFSIWRKYNRMTKGISNNRKLDMKKERNNEISEILMKILNVAGLLIMLSNITYVIRIAYELFAGDKTEFSYYLFMQGPQFVVLTVGFIMNLHFIFIEKNKESKQAKRIAIIFTIGTLLQILGILNYIIPLGIVIIHWIVLRNKEKN